MKSLSTLIRRRDEGGIVIGEPRIGARGDTDLFAPGIYTVLALAEGYKPWKGSIEILAGRSAVLEVRIEPE